MLTETVGQRKKRLRRQIQERRRLLNPQIKNQRDDQIADRLCHFIHQNSFDRIFSFMATREEPDITDRLSQLCPRLEIYVPIVQSDFSMSFHLIRAGDARRTNSFGIEEPFITAPTAQNTDKSLILVPCLAVSAVGNRLGYGGGYYDRYFSIYPDGSKVGIIYSEFVIEVESEPHDFRLDGYCTEEDLVLLRSS